MTSARAAAARVLTQVLRHARMLDADLIRGFTGGFDARDSAFVQELCFGVTRRYYCLERTCAQLLERPLRARDADIQALLLCGVYQLGELGTPAHAAIKETAEGARELQKEWAVPLINGVMRRYQREQASIDALAGRDRYCRYSLPRWMLEAIRRDWPLEWETIARASAERPPQHVRVNLSMITRAAYLNRLHEDGIEATPAAWVNSGLRIGAPRPVESLPGFADGLVSIQDFGAQLAAGILNVQPGERVLDACAAPGGKTAHLYESCPALGTLVAVESDAQRLGRLRETLTRTGTRAQVLHADASRPEEWWDGVPFDRILLDAPCSALGVMRRHPDIRIHRTRAQCTRLAGIQERLLDAVWGLLRPGGTLLYATCSLLSRENDARIEKFMSVHKDVTVVNLTSSWGKATEYGRQTLPGYEDTDGFYYALLARH